jgi:hypothetical protein
MKFKNKSFIFIEPYLIESEAYRMLSGKAAVTCLLRFHQKAYRKNKTGKKKGMKDRIITNQGEIIFTYAEAKELGISSSKTFNKMIHELVEEKGFIDIAEQGNWYSKQPTKFGISERWKKFGTPDYRSVVIQRILPDGIGFPKKIQK